MKWRHGLLLGIAGLLALSAGWLSYRSVGAARSNAPLLPQFTLPDAAGVRHDSSEWRGKVLVINFWATWCPPCRREIPEFIELQEAMGERGLQFIGIAVEEAEPVRRFMRQMRFNYPVLIGEEGGMSLSLQLGNRMGVLPFTAVIDRNGAVVRAHPGPFTGDRVRALVEPLLDEGP